MRKYLMAACAVACLSPFPASATTPGGCKEPKTGTNQVPIFSPPLSKVVIGTGRLQFYSAPNAACRVNGVFVIPGDSLVAYAETKDGWTSVMYLGGSSPEGWVRSARLRTSGTVGPAQ